MFELKKYLMKVNKPSQYMGNELNSVHKLATDYDVHGCLVFPDLYEVGMSSLGVHILYNIINNMPNMYMERAFAPDVDFESILREKNIPMFSLETKTPLRDMDIVGFSLSYELSYTNVLNILDLAKIELYSKDRNESDPIILAGGTCAYNPTVMKNFFDVFLLGEGEELLAEVFTVFRENKNKSRDEKLKVLAKIEGVYVPKFYNGQRIKKRIVKDFNKLDYEFKQIVPYMKVVHDRAILEIQRGCTRGCRFCQAGMVYRPVREKNVKKNIQDMEKIFQSTGYNEISLTSLSSSDYSKLSELIDEFYKKYSDMNISVSLPSLRMNPHSVKMAEKIQEGKKTGFTFAPEAGSQRLRDIINKGVTEQEIMDTAEAAVKAGWTRLKFYFMIGLPYETYEDIQEIKDLVDRVLGKCVPIDRRLSITVSISNFVPKPHTPFQWSKQMNMEEMREKHKFIREIFTKNKRVNLKVHEKEISYLEGFLSRGDEKIGEVVKKAWENGAKFESWREHFKFEAWTKAMKELNIVESDYLGERKIDESLPWEFVDIGVSREYMLAELEAGKKGDLTSDCRDQCNICGLNKKLEGKRIFSE